MWDTPAVSLEYLFHSASTEADGSSGPGRCPKILLKKLVDMMACVDSSLSDSRHLALRTPQEATLKLNCITIFSLLNEWADFICHLTEYISNGHRFYKAWSLYLSL